MHKLLSMAPKITFKMTHLSHIRPLIIFMLGFKIYFHYELDFIFQMPFYQFLQFFLFLYKNNLDF